MALPNTAVDFVNRQYFKAGLYKVSENSGEALKGAVIRLVRVDDGKIIDEWTTDGSVHMINLIEIGTGTFRFVEVKSPSGYHLAKNIEFKMSEDGEFSSTYDHIYDDDGNAIFIMRDPKDARTGDEAPLASFAAEMRYNLRDLENGLMRFITMNILVVDDEKEIADLIGIYLQNEDTMSSHAAGLRA